MSSEKAVEPFGDSVGRGFGHRLRGHASATAVAAVTLVLEFISCQVNPACAGQQAPKDKNPAFSFFGKIRNFTTPHLRSAPGGQCADGVL